MKYCPKRNRPSDSSIVSAHADVSSNPRATNAPKHCWIQNAARWFDRNEVRSRKPRRTSDVDPPIQNVPVWAAHQGGADETVDGLVAGFTKRFSRKLVQDPKVPSREPGAISELHRSRRDRRSRNESSGRIGSRSQPNTRPKR